MKSEIKYIELKSGYQDDGPAWIGLVWLNSPKRDKQFISMVVLLKVMDTDYALI